MITYQKNISADAEASIILLFKEDVTNGNVPLPNEELKQQLISLAKDKRFQGENGELYPLTINAHLFLLCGLGPAKELCLTSLRKNVRSVCLSSYLKPIKTVQIVASKHDQDLFVPIIEAIKLGTYRWEKYITPPKKSNLIKDKQYLLICTKKKAHEDALTICEGTNFTRDLVNDNADTVTSEFLEQAVKDVIKGHKNAKLTVFNEKELRANGFGLHLAVNQGSRKEPKLLIVEYKGGKAKDKYTAIVGKGITFDTGGLNIKSSGHIECMRYDMGGTGSVIGVLKNILALNIKKNIIFACAIAENACGSGSYKPGDVFKSYSGKTVEIANTDAEGRLVLADALAYLTKKYPLKRIIDIATLTGACVIALGHDYTAVMSSDDDFAQRLLKSAQATDDRAWQLPIYPELKESVKSKIADIKNLGYPRGAAGTITAGEFLRQFTNDVPWAHLDIAGTAFSDGEGRMYFGHGATGSSVRLLTHFLRNN